MLIFSIALFAAAVHAEPSSHSAESARPLQDTLQTLAGASLEVFSIEEAPYRCPRDIVATPGPAPVTRAFRATADSSAPFHEKVQQIVSAWNAAYPGTTHGVEVSHGIVHVKPLTAPDAACTSQAISPLLDTIIDVPSAMRSPGATIEAVLEDVATKRGVRLSLPYPYNNLDTAPAVLVDTEGVRARDAIANALSASTTVYSWHLRHSPAIDAFVLSLIPISVPERRTDLIGPGSFLDDDDW